jgi:hypothetical protein
MARTTMAFALAPLWGTAATAVFACYAFPYPEQRHWIVITAIIGTIFGYAGTLILGIPAYRFLLFRHQTSPWIAVALGFAIGCVTWAVFLFFFAFSLGDSSAFAWHELATNSGQWLSFLPIGALGSIIGLTIWLIARPDRHNSGVREIRAADTSSPR